jgi:tetratricopeptide (TPR) repeat protein
MPYTEDQLWSMLGEANDLPFDATRIAHVERVIAHADAAGAAQLQFLARMSATSAYAIGGEPAKSFVTFEWCLAEYDRDPVAHQERLANLLWHFKYIVGALSRFPDVPLAHAMDVLDDMQRRYRAAGYGMHAVYAYRHAIAKHVGDPEAADWFGKWCAEPRDALSDCVGCDPESKAAWLASSGRDEEAIALAEPVLAGDMSCVEQPQGILTTLMLAYLRTGRLAEARDAHRQAYRAQRSRVADMSGVAEHIKFCAVTGNEIRGLALVETHLAWLDAPPSPGAAMDFAACAALLLRRLDEIGHGDTRVHRPAYRSRTAADVPAGELRDELATIALEIARRFDLRNGSTHQTEQVAATLSMKPVVASLALSPVATRLVAAAPIETGTAIIAAMSADDLLDLAERHHRMDHEAGARAACEAFDDRYGLGDLTLVQRARRADMHGVLSANAGDFGVAEIAWMSALDLYTEGGDEVRRQVARGRLGQLMCRTDRAEVGVPIAQDATDYLTSRGPASMVTTAYRRMAMVYVLAGRADEALANIALAAAHVPDSDDPYASARVLVDHAAMLGEFGRLTEARELADRARETCRSIHYPVGLAAACWISGRASEMSGDTDAALAAYDEALAVAGAAEMVTEVRLQRATLLASSRRAAEAIDDLVDLLATATDPAVRDGARHQLALAYLNADRPLDSAEIAEEALTGYAEDDPGAETIRHLLAQAYRRLNLVDQAIEQLALVVASGERRDEPALVGEMTEQIAEILCDEDRDAAAAAKFAEAAAAYQNAGLTVHQVRTRRRHVMSLLWAGAEDRIADALAEADLAALEMTGDDPGAIWERAMLACDGARILEALGDLDGAVIRIGPVVAAFRDVGDVSAATFAGGIQGHLLLRVGRPAAAEPVLAAALDAAADEDVRQRLALALVSALGALGRGVEAAALRKRFGLISRSTSDHDEP